MWQVLSGIERRLYRVYLNTWTNLRMSYSQKTRKNCTCSQIVFEVLPPRFPELNPSDYLSLGTLRVLVYLVAIGKKETLNQRVLRPVRPFETAPGHMKLCNSPRSCVHMGNDWDGGYFWAFFVTCNIVNNKKFIVIGLGLSKHFRNNLYIKNSWERGDVDFISTNVRGAKMHNAMLHDYRKCQVFPLRYNCLR